MSLLKGGRGSNAAREAFLINPQYVQSPVSMVTEAYIVYFVHVSGVLCLVCFSPNWPV